MAVTIVRLFAPTVLTTGAAVLYTCPTNPSSSVLKNGRVRFTNTSGAAVSVTAYAVPSGGSAAAGNCFLNAESVPANSHMDADVPTLATGDTLQALASSATSITALEVGGLLFS